MFGFFRERERENELETVQQFNFKDLWPELKCGLCEHHLKCQNNHQHDYGHPRKEEEESAIKMRGALSPPQFRVQELCESRGGRPGLSVLLVLLPKIFRINV